MKCSKTTKLVGDLTVDALLVDREDGIAAQAFTLIELNDIRVNTLSHAASLDAKKDDGLIASVAYEEFCVKDDDGKSVVDASLEDIDNLIAECGILGIK